MKLKCLLIWCRSHKTDASRLVAREEINRKKQKKKNKRKKQTTKTFE